MPDAMRSSFRIECLELAERRIDGSPLQFSAKAVYPCVYAGFTTPDAYNAMLRKICQQEKHDFYWFFSAPDLVQGLTCLSESLIFTGFFHSLAFLVASLHNRNPEKI
jgi:hypothetical protein